MVIVTADNQMHVVIGNLAEPAEIVDSGGNVLGYYTPARVRDAKAYAEARQHFDPEVLKRRRETGPVGRTTKEVLERLKAMEQP